MSLIVKGGYNFGQKFDNGNIIEFNNRISLGKEWEKLINDLLEDVKNPMINVLAIVLIINSFIQTMIMWIQYAYPTTIKIGNIMITISVMTTGIVSIIALFCTNENKTRDHRNYEIKYINEEFQMVYRKEKKYYCHKLIVMIIGSFLYGLMILSIMTIMIVITDNRPV